MEDKLHPIFSNLVISSVLELSQDLSFPCQQMPSDTKVAVSIDEALAAVIGYSSPEMKGSVTVISTKSLLRKSHPNLQMEMPVGEQDLEDWIGEISNQLLGRMKNKLLKFGTTLAMATPSILMGRSLISRQPKDGSRLSFRFESELGALAVTVDVVLSPGYVFQAKEAISSTAEKEGASILF